MRQPSTSAGAPRELRGATPSTSSSTRAASTPSASEVAAPPRAHARRRATPCAAGVTTVTNRHGREWCGAGARHAASTSASSTAGRPGSSVNARIERRASMNAGTCARSPEQVFGRGADQLRRPPPRGTRSASRPRTIAGRDPRGLAHHELGRCRDLVGDRDLGDVELAPARVGRAAEVDDAGEPGDADRDVGEAAAPGAAERVGDDDRHLDTVAGPERVADLRAPTGRCRRGAARPEPSSTFERSMPALAHTKPCSVSLMIRSPRRRRTRRDSCSMSAASRVEVVGIERDEAALGLRDDLLRHDDAVAVERAVCPARWPRRRSGRRAGSPGRTSGIPAIGVMTSPVLIRTRSRDGVEGVARQRRGDAGVGHQRVGDDRAHAVASTSAARGARRRRRSRACCRTRRRRARRRRTRRRGRGRP